MTILKITDARPPIEDNSRPINIKLHQPDGTYIQFIVRIKTPLEKLMTSYCESFEMPVLNTRFQFKGVPISGNDTPLSLKMEENDIIDAIYINF
ncbi:PREDICTED: small ubiquitin-related modifier 4-like [Diuraphis noxia]|uniref:small ubiquitin-related modifier 4-like n=1 Tax=Diuraphis noxia TaxID=143948 RepID=UPI0007637FC6|nr:PREDICTED: small ubiquitin-related modifier 4-like [Diuraphis noxia]